MKTEFDVCGTHIPYSEIQDYRMIQCEYIYRPVYRENVNFFSRLSLQSKYEFHSMVPYAAVVDENKYGLSTKKWKHNENSFTDSVKKDVAVGVVTTIADKLNIKELKYKKYRCRNAAGRVFTAFLQDIPAAVIRDDGKYYDLTTDNPNYKLLGEPISPAITMIPALLIIAKQEYLFYGNGIQLNDVEQAYIALRTNMEEYRATLLTEKSARKTLRVELPKVELPRLIGKIIPNSKDTELTVKSNDSSEEKQEQS